MSLRIRIGPFTFGKSGTRLSLWRGGSGFSIPIFNRKAQSFGKLKIGIFSYFFNSKPKFRSNKRTSIEQKRTENTKLSYQNSIKKTRTQAYEPWSKEADEKLMRLLEQGKTINELSEIFGRTNSAIRSRIEKLTLRQTL